MQVLFSALCLEPFLLFPVLFGNLRWSSQRFSGKADSLLLEVVAVGSGSVHRISDHHLRQVAVTLAVGFYLAFQVSPFVEGIPAQVVYAGDSIAGEAGTEFGTKLNRFALFATYDGAHVGLADADNPVITAPGVVVVHLFLLLVEVLDHPVAV